jgi:phage baseplate assembly protein W
VKNRFQAFAFECNLYRYNAAKEIARKIKRAVRKTLSRRVAGAFITWHDRARDNKTTLRRTVHRMTRVKVMCSFSRWKANVADRKTRALALARAERMTRRVRNRAAGCAFDTWRQTAAGCRSARATLTSALSRMLRTSLARAFATWWGLYTLN